MKGKISLKEFILGVKNELVEASESSADRPFFELMEVRLDAAFHLEAKAGAKFKFLVEAGGETNAKQQHAVTLVFKPLPVAASSAQFGGGGGSGAALPPGFTTPVATVNIPGYFPNPNDPPHPGGLPGQPTGPVFQGIEDLQNTIEQLRRQVEELDFSGQLVPWTVKPESGSDPEASA
nr:hypothetical protein [Oceanococcus sp. HetDA_MAG_MS8]